MALRKSLNTKGMQVMAEEQKKEPEGAENTEYNQKAARGSVFEGIYEQLPDISIRSLDRFILLCVVALVAVILFGVLKAQHVF